MQAHRDVQLLAWAAVFIMALSFEFVVRLNQATALSERWRGLALSGLALGALAQGAGQLFHAEMGWLWLPGSVLSLAGAAAGAVLIFQVKPGFAPGSAFNAWWLKSSMLWLVVLTALGAAAATRGTEGVARPADSHLLVEIFIRGFVSSAVVGVALRAFPGHLGLSPVSLRRQQAIMTGLNSSLIVWALGSSGFGLPESALAQRSADVILAVTLLFATQSLGVMRAFRLSWSPPRYHMLLPWAWVGLLLYALALASAAALPGWGERTLYETGAVRHLFMLGFMAPLMAAMAHIVLDRFANRELVAPRTLLASFLLLQAAWPLRVIPVLVDDDPGDTTKGLVGLGGVLAVAGLALLALAAGRTSMVLRRRNRWNSLPQVLRKP